MEILNVEYIVKCTLQTRVNLAAFSNRKYYFHCCSNTVLTKCKTLSDAFQVIEVELPSMGLDIVDPPCIGKVNIKLLLSCEEFTVLESMFPFKKQCECVFPDGLKLPYARYPVYFHNDKCRIIMLKNRIVKLIYVPRGVERGDLFDQRKIKAILGELSTL